MQDNIKLKKVVAQTLFAKITVYRHFGFLMNYVYKTFIPGMLNYIPSLKFGSFKKK